jgi:hypothetical protein
VGLGAQVHGISCLGALADAEHYDAATVRACSQPTAVAGGAAYTVLVVVKDCQTQLAGIGEFWAKGFRRGVDVRVCSGSESQVRVTAVAVGPEQSKPCLSTPPDHAPSNMPLATPPSCRDGHAHCSHSSRQVRRPCNAMNEAQHEAHLAQLCLGQELHPNGCCDPSQDKVASQADQAHRVQAEQGGDWNSIRPTEPGPAYD